MPHINRIRVNNIKYNFGTQFYDDFVMRFDGKNALYDLANGGGKSVLMLLLFQNLIPNCTLDDKQPVEKLFRTNDGSTSIHSLVEWKLDDCDVEDGYRYMLTGFCARKAKDDGDEAQIREAASIDYFNYVIFYRSYNDNDLVNLPLSKGKERMTYVGLRAYLKELEHKDYSLKIKLFDRKGEYQRYISRYGLFESQWEIIRGINKTEGHVRTYFENSYKTTRKVVEDLLIEEIIQKAFMNKAEGTDEDMAGTLLSIREKLLELSKKRKEIDSYDHQMEALDGFSGRVRSLSQLYEEEDKFRYDLIKAYNGILTALKMQERTQAVNQKEKEFTEKHMAEIARKLDTVKVQRNQEMLKNLESDTTKIDEEVRLLEAEYGRVAIELAAAECMRDYFEYEENARNAEITRRAIAGADSGHEELLGQLKQLSWQGKVLIDEKLAQLTEKINQTKKYLSQLEQEISKEKENIRRGDMQAAVLESQLVQGSASEKQLIHEISELRQSVNALLIEGNERELRDYKNKEKRVQEENAAALAQIEKLGQEIQESSLAIEQGKAQVIAGDYQKKTFEQFFEEYDAYSPKANHLLKIYGAEHYEQLKTKIYDRYKKMAAEIYLADTERKNLEQYKEQLTEKNPIVVGDHVERVMDYLRRYHNISCIAGCDYLKGLDKEEKIQILENLPFLPYSVVVMSDFGSLSDDTVFRTKDFGQYQVPVIRQEAVITGTKMVDEHQILFTGRDKLLFTDDEVIAAEIETTEKKISEMSIRISRYKDQEKTYMEDLAYIHHFMDTYYLQRTEILRQKDAFEKTMDEVKKHIAQLENDLKEEKRQLNEVRENQQILEKAYADASAERQAVEKMVGLNQKLYTLRDEMKKYHQQKQQTDEALKQAKAILADKQNEDSSICKQLDNYENRYAVLKQMWQTEFSLYYTDGQYEESSMQLSEVEVAFKAAVQSYKAGHTDMEDKKKLLANYERTMERLKFAIESRHMTMEQVKEMRDGETFVACDAQTIMQLRQMMEKISGDIRFKKTLADDSRADKHRLTGRVENAISVIEEKYGYYQAIDLKNMDYEVFVKEYTISYEQMKEKVQQLAKDIEKSVKEFRFLEDMKKDMERLIRSISVPMNFTKDSLRPDENFRQKIKELTEWYERLCKDEDLKKSEFEKNKDTLVETLRTFKAYDLADEIRFHVMLPTTGNQADELLKNISETVKIIMLEKDRIEKGIEDMQKIKENFENQCIQRCTDIKMELDRLPKMSRITLGDETIQMVMLKIPYVREEYYSQRMSAYIDEIVEKSDAYENESDRIKYLRHQLAWKHLFSVIVSDMDSIRMSLYKRERIREQSRFLRYEEAVGSTGQSQGIYIQFLIAVINYISAINSRNTEAAALKKVIFIDNPFGAAKDIYIWEPIFALLKENNVQLIVPARGATPAITGKFDVNYVLGQKLIGSRQQTVVIDYHSNINIEEVEYRQIDFEQEVFDFI